MQTYGKQAKTNKIVPRKSVNRKDYAIKNNNNLINTTINITI